MSCLPIEWKVEEKFKKKGHQKNEVDVIKFRKECREFADHWVNEQKFNLAALELILTGRKFI